MNRLSQESAEQAWWRSGGRCEAPKCGRVAEEWHHIFSQQKYPELADNTRNIVSLCKKHHSGHHSAMHRLPRSVCHRAEILARDSSMLLYLDRFYGKPSFASSEPAVEKNIERDVCAFLGSLGPVGDTRR